MSEDHEMRDRLILLKRELNRYEGQKFTAPSQGLVGAVVGELTARLGGREARLKFLRWAFNPFVVSSTELPDWQKFGLVVWASPMKLTPDDKWHCCRQFREDCELLKKKFAEAQDA